MQVCCLTVQDSTVQYGAVRYGTGQYSTGYYVTSQFSKVQHITMCYNAMQRRTELCGIVARECSPYLFISLTSFFSFFLSLFFLDGEYCKTSIVWNRATIKRIKRYKYHS
jgi:hypothetical protein